MKELQLEFIKKDKTNSVLVETVYFVMDIQDFLLILISGKKI